MCSDLTLRIDPEAQVGTPLRDLAYQTVRRAIQLGYFRPGEHLSEHRLTRDLGISRTPIRDALRKLEADRWVRRKRTGLVVVDLDARDVDELFAVRGLLETYAARVAAQRADTAGVAALRQLNQQFRVACQERRGADVVQCNIGFHQTLNGLADNRILSEMVNQLGERMRLLTALVLTDPELSERSAEEHDKIVDAIEQGDADLAEARMREHLRRNEGAYTLRVRSAAEGG